MDTHREWIDARIAEGRINASELHRELASTGVRLSYATVRRFLTQRLGRSGTTRPRVNAAKPKPAPPQSPKQLAFDWVRRPEKRTVEAQGRLDAIRAARPDLSAALDLADEFTALIRKRSTGTLKEWLSRAEVSPCPEVSHFAEGIRRDESAVNADYRGRPTCLIGTQKTNRQSLMSSLVVLLIFGVMVHRGTAPADRVAGTGSHVLGIVQLFVESQIGKLSAPDGRAERGFILGVEEGSVREKHGMKGFGRNGGEMAATQKRRRESGKR